MDMALDSTAIEAWMVASLGFSEMEFGRGGHGMVWS